MMPDEMKKNPWEGRHPSTTHFQPLFASGHLPPFLREVSEPCERLAEQMLETLPDGIELSAGLRKLKEAKDCFVSHRVLNPPPATVQTSSGTFTVPVGATGRGIKEEAVAQKQVVLYGGATVDDLELRTVQGHLLDADQYRATPGAELWVGPRAGWGG